MTEGQVPEDLQSILNDSALFTNSSDITTKEILKRYGDIGRTPALHTNILAESADSPAQVPSSATAPNSGDPPNARAAAPVITHVDTDPYQNVAWPNESSVRHVQGQAPVNSAHPNNGGTNTPPQPPYTEWTNPKSAYHRRGGSSESQVSNRSGGGPGPQTYKHSGWGKQGPANGGVGITGTI